MTIRRLLRRLANRRGAAIIFVAFALFMLIAMAGLAIDVGYIYTVRNELQNAADSAALAGAQVLYDDPATTADDPPGSHVNPNANAEALSFLTQNYSEKVQVSPESIERGHWSFTTRTFTANETDLDPVSLWNVSTEELDVNPHFINAVRVVTQRKRDAGQLPEPFFARIFGGQAKEINAVAVAYIGFAGTLAPTEAEQPIAICQQAITDSDGSYTCSRGRMINSGQTYNVQTGGWTNFTQGPCDTASTPTVRPLVCGTGNPNPLVYGNGMGSVGGEIQTVYDSLRDCWMSAPGIDANSDGWPDRIWTLRLPVIDCPGNNVGPCSTLVGAVEVNVVWITRNDKNQMNEVPRKMEGWPGEDDGVPYNPTTGLCTGTAAECWASFVQHFNLKQNVDPTASAIYDDKTLYFLPDCDRQEPAGLTGGTNFGILAKIPVLVNPYTLVK
jgi:hypothetical protein